MPASPCFSDKRLRVWALIAGSCALVWASGCVTVRPEDKEYLAEPSMTWAQNGFGARHEGHVLENREGSAGGSQTHGGGCGCN